MTAFQAGLHKRLMEDCRRADEIVCANLRKILREQADTAFGREYHFDRICDTDMYRKTVPLSDYERFRPYVERMRAGETDVLTSYPLAGFCMTSGSTGQAKCIPLTREALGRYGDTLQAYRDEVYAKTGGKRMFVNTFRTDVDVPAGSVLLCSEICYRYLYETGSLSMEEYVGERPLFFQREPGDRLYAKAWAAFLEADVTILESIFLYDVLIFFHYLEDHWREVIRDIRRRQIPKEHRLPSETAAYLLALEADEERLCRVEHECGKGFTGIAKRLWGRLRLVSGISMAAYRTEDRALQRYIGDVPVSYFCYCASECYIGAESAEGSLDYVLLPKNAFYEFLPVEDGSGETEGKETLLIDQIEAGDAYEMVVTNFSGLYRYRMGDVVEVTGFFGKSPVLRFLFRRQQALNIAGEKVSLQLIESAVRSLEKYQIRLQGYCFGISAEEVPGRYLAAVTLEEGSACEGEEQIARRLDEWLQEHNPDYQDLRILGYIGALYVRIFSRETYGRFQEEAGLTQGHCKPRHIVPGGLTRGMFERASDTDKECR